MALKLKHVGPGLYSGTDASSGAILSVRWLEKYEAFGQVFGGDGWIYEINSIRQDDGPVPTKREALALLEDLLTNPSLEPNY